MALVDLRRDPEADCDDALVEELADGRLEAVEQRVLVLDRRRVLTVADHRSVAGDQTGQDLRPADVHTDHLGIQGRRLP